MKNKGLFNIKVEFDNVPIVNAKNQTMEQFTDTIEIVKKKCSGGK